MSAQAVGRSSKDRTSVWPSIQNSLAKMDYQLIAVVATLLLVGLVMVFSASFSVAGTYYFIAQLKWVVVGVLACAVVACIPYEFWRKMAIPALLFTVLILIAVLVLGQRSEYGGTRTFTGARFQPSELAKLGVAIYVAAWVAARGRKVADFKEGFFPFAVIIGLVAGLIVLEQSVSMTVIVLTIGLAIYFVGGGAFKQFLLLGIFGLPVLALAMWKFGYPLGRIQGWYNVWFDQAKAPQDLLEMTWLIRSGNGIGLDPAVWSVKSSVFGLWSDFLFANIGADFTIVGMIVVVALFCWFGYRAIGIALNAPTRFGSLLAVGLTAWILVQAGIHMGASLTLFPATGQPLPFMSYGGSSLVSCMIATGLLLSISRSAKEKKSPNAHFAIGGRDWRPRLPNLGGTRSDTSGRRDPEDRRDPAGRTDPGTRRPPAGRSRGRTTPGRNTPVRRPSRQPANDKGRRL
jgi:cell division protein FtsW